VEIVTSLVEKEKKTPTRKFWCGF